eukprot:3914249-Rhodomonas_salina.2
MVLRQDTAVQVLLGLFLFAVYFIVAGCDPLLRPPSCDSPLATPDATPCLRIPSCDPLLRLPFVTTSCDPSLREIEYKLALPPSKLFYL